MEPGRESNSGEDELNNADGLGCVMFARILDAEQLQTKKQPSQRMAEVVFSCCGLIAN